jgi:ribosomal protein L15E
MNDAVMVETLTFDERKKVVIERQENPVVLDRERELFPVSITKPVVLASGVNLPPALAKPVGNGNPDVLVAIPGASCRSGF